MYTVDYFIKKFEAIPEHMWLSGQLECNGAKCALGLLGYDRLREISELFEDRLALAELLIKNGFDCYDWSGFANGKEGYQKQYWTIAGINDGFHPNYDQDTPKQRILAALYDIKNMQQPEYKDITSELAVLPIDETADQPTQILHL